MHARSNRCSATIVLSCIETSAFTTTYGRKSLALTTFTAITVLAILRDMLHVIRLSFVFFPAFLYDVKAPFSLINTTLFIVLGLIALSVSVRL